VETRTISLGVAEDSRPDVRVEDDRALVGFAFNKQSRCHRGPVDRQRERSDVKSHGLTGKSRQRRSWEVSESRPGEIKGVAVAAITPVLIHDSYRRRGIGRSKQREVDARVSQ